MSRPGKRRGRLRLLAWLLAATVTVAVAAFAVFIVPLLGLAAGCPMESEARELTVEERAGALRSLAPGVEVLAGFKAHSYGGFHGDGGSITIYLIDPAGAGALVEGLKRWQAGKREEWPGRFHYEWGTASHAGMNSLGHLVPDRFHPGPGSYLVSRELKRMGRIYIEPRRGYVSFLTSRT